MVTKIVPWGRCRICRKTFPVTDLHDRLPGKFVGTCERCLQHKDAVPEETVRGFIYFVRGELSGLIKIGYTTNLDWHIKTLQAYSGEVLSVMATQQGTVSLEESLHQQFVKDNVRGEWFFPSKELLQYISELS